MAQFGSVLHWGCRGRGFKSHYSNMSVMKFAKWSHRLSVEYKSVNKVDTVAVSFTRAATLRGVAQVVERVLREHEVVGSSPVTPIGVVCVRFGGANGAFNHSLGDSDLGYTLIQA